MSLPHFDVLCDLLLNRHTATWNLFITTHKAFVYFFNITPRKPAAPLPTLAKTKKKIDIIYDLYKMKQFHCDWLRKITPLSNLTRGSLLVEWKLTAKTELNCEIYKFWRRRWKNQVSFCHRSRPVSQKALTLPWKLQELKKYPRKTCGCGQPRGHLIRVLNELKGA